MPVADQDRTVLPDGSTVMIRPLTAGDEASMVSWFADRFAQLSPDVLYARAFALVQYVDPRVHPRLRQADRGDHVTIAALGLDGILVGIARLDRVDESRSAEVSVSVSDHWRRRGVASMLLEQVAARARSIGIKQLTACCLATEPLIRLISTLGATTVERSKPGLVDLRVRLT
jgi:GNAT superfamily N-acetyltransferase